MFGSIRWRVALPMVLLILLSIVGLTDYLLERIRQDYLADLRGHLAADALLLAADAAALWAEGEAGGALDDLARERSAQLQAQVTFIGQDGAVLGESHADRTRMQNQQGRPEVKAALANGLGESQRYSEATGQAMVYVAVRVEAGPRRGVARVGLPLEPIQARVAQLRRATLTAGLPVMAVATLLALLIADRTAQPVRRLARAAERMAEGHLVPLSPTARGEIGQLTRALDSLATRLQAMSLLAAERKRLATVLEHMADGVIITDDQSSVSLLNPAAARLLGVTREEALGVSLAQVVRHHQLVELWRRAQQRSSQQEEAVEVDRQGLFLQAIVTPLASDQPGFLLILQDLTRLRRLETVRRDFVSNISHELRTPLASLKALVDTLRDGALEDPPAAQRFLDHMDTELDALTQMVQELLELSRIESGQVPLRLHQVAVAEVLAPPTERLRPQAERAGLTLSLAIPPALPAVLADAERMQQVVTNLVHNAIKFTPAGGYVSVSVEVGPGEVIFSVRDTGVGIPAADLPRIFERFYKADRARRRGGTGLGLAIAKHIVQGHGGRLWVESQEGRGSAFHFSLPQASPWASSAQRAPSPAGP